MFFPLLDLVDFEDLFVKPDTDISDFPSSNILVFFLHSS